MNERENDLSIFAPVRRPISYLQEKIHRRLTPEQECLLGVGTIVACFGVLTGAEFVPEHVLELYQWFSEYLPSYEVSYAVTGFSLGSALAFDGANRIREERVHLIKAYYHVFIEDFFDQ